MIGTTISHYKILEKLGEGGMGVVYKGQDLTLDRPVALKFLPPRLGASDEEKLRLIQEARAASALNHPNVATIHEIGDEGGQTFLVMEYVDGVTLREKVQSGPPKIKEAVSVALQAAEALQKAHEQQIVHRDIKSDNIMITKDGLVKVMDFGLAKLKGAAKLTKSGSTVGTAAYMAPEQIQGEASDHRADIFSYGVVLYEMLTGRLPFRGEHEAALMYEIVNVEPPSLSSVRGEVDAELNRIVMKSLEKDRDERYQSMREVVVDLKRYKRDSEGRRPEQPLQALRERTRLPKKLRIPTLLIGLLILALVGTILWMYFGTGRLEERPALQARLMKITSTPGLEDEPTWSPDGKFLAYTTDERGNLDIAVLPLGGGQPIWVVDNPADDAQPSWSPDGSKLAFVSARDHGGRLSIAIGLGQLQWYVNGKGGDIFLVPALGGGPVKLVDNGYYPSWSPDGKSIVYQSNRGGQWNLWTVPSEGGQATQLTNDVDIDYHPSWSPDGEWIVYGAGTAGEFEVRTIPAKGGQARALTGKQGVIVKPAWTADGRQILFSSSQSGVMNIWKIPFSPSGGPKSAEPTRVTLGEGNDASVSVAQDGKRIAFATERNTPDVWEFLLASQQLRQVSHETSLEEYPRPSPDGKTLLVTSDRGGSVALWTIDLNGRVLSRLTSSGQFASWSPDGKEIAFTVSGRIVTQRLGDISTREIETGQSNFPIWSPDGTKLTYNRVQDGKTDVWVYSFETGEKKQLTYLDSENSFPTWSPDAKEITFNAEKGGIRHIWIIPSRGGTPRQLTDGESEHSHPQWSPVEKDQILFLIDHKNLALLSVSTGKIKQLTNFVEANTIIDYPSWSFDGKKIFFSLAKKVGDVYILENY